MRKHIFAIISLLLVASQLSACVVYSRPYPRPYYYHWWYR
jgi:hypothetical protein